MGIYPSILRTPPQSVIIHPPPRMLPITLLDKSTKKIGLVLAGADTPVKPRLISGGALELIVIYISVARHFHVTLA